MLRVVQAAIAFHGRGGGLIAESLSTAATGLTVLVARGLIAQAITAAPAGLAFLIGRLGHRRRLSHRRVHVHHQVAEHRIAEAERARQVTERLLIALDVHEHVVRFVHLGDGIGELAPAPILEAMDAAGAGGDHALVALDHRGHLLALIGMDQEYDLVMPHVSSSRIEAARREADAGCGKEIPPAGRRGAAPSTGGAQDTETAAGLQSAAPQGSATERWRTAP